MCILFGLSCDNSSAERAAEDRAAFEYLVGKDSFPREKTRHGALWYQINAAPEELLVHIRLFDPPDRATFFLPGEWAGRSDYADAIEIRGADSPDGELLYTIDRASGRIDIKSKDAPWIQLNYAVRLSQKRGDPARFQPHFIDEILFAYGPAFLLLPSDQLIRPMRDILIEVHAPADWRLLSTWDKADSAPSNQDSATRVHGFIAASPAALRDAYLVAGRALQIQRVDALKTQRASKTQRDPTSPIAVAFDPNLELNEDEFTHYIAKILDYYREKFGDLGPASVYIRRAPGDVVEQRGVGRRGGFVVELSAKNSSESPSPPQRSAHAHPPEIAPSTLLLLAHEAFHLWNGHYLTPRASSELKTRWFKEGLTHYMALKTLSRLELISQEELLKELNRAADYYSRNPATDPRLAAHADATDYARLPYDRGLLIALALDTFLFEASAGELTLEDWIVYLLEQMSARGQDYSAAHLRAGFLEVCHLAEVDQDAARFWDDLIGQDRLLRPAEIFAQSGLHWLNPSPQRPSRLLPMESEQSPFRTLFFPAPTRDTPTRISK